MHDTLVGSTGGTSIGEPVHGWVGMWVGMSVEIGLVIIVTSRDVTRRRATSRDSRDALFFNYTFLLASLRVHKVQIIVNISCLVPLKSS